MGSAGAGESSDEGNWFPLGFSPSALPSVILAGRDGRMDGGAPATPGPAWGEEPWEGAGLPEPRLMLPPAWGHVTAWPAPPRRPVRTAPLQLRTASGWFFGPPFVSGPAPFGPPFVSVCGFTPICSRSGSWTAAVRFWLQLICGSCLFLLWFQSSRWTAPAPAPCGSSSWMALAQFCSCSLWLQLICTFSFGSSSFAAPVCFCSGSSPADGRLQPQLIAAPAHGWLWLIPAPLPCGCSSFAPSVLAAARLRLLFVSALDSVRLMDGSSSIPAHLDSSSWMALAHFSPCSLWLQLICTFRSSSWWAPVGFHLLGSFGSSPLMVPARFRLQLLGGSSSGSSPSPSQLVLVQLLLAFGQVVNQSLSWPVYEYELS
ncbi:uncharacterized protein LOC134516529 isoform X1 [Chroicocephalus ridibundus]|uniref:uncharacterized protein LOC134516529 isoform X1 n=1 Tax=Chroicocephalus ridibundus TaxID=1192867 RepID=UPI002FDE070D